MIHRRYLGSWIQPLFMVMILSNLYSQVLIDKQITVQPFQVTNGSITGNPSLTLFELETDKIWAQAGIDVKFLPALQISNGAFLDVSSSAFDSNSLQALSALPAAAVPANVVQLFFVESINSSGSIYGYSLQSGYKDNTAVGGGIIITQRTAVSISNNVFSFASGAGMRDVIAHELGHSLSLNHTTLGAGALGNLMSEPRSFPTSAGNIFPDGADYGQLTGTIGGTSVGSDTDGSGLQIDRARAMPIAVNLGAESFYYSAVPEPAEYAGLVGGVVLTITFISRRRGLLFRKNRLSTPDARV